MTRRRAMVLAMLGAVAGLILLLGTATLGLRLRAAGEQVALPGAAPLDYGAAPFGAFSPLSPSFITNVLGGIVAFPARGDRSTTQDSRIPGSPGPRATTTKRIELVHPLTNDDRSLAREIPSVPFTARTDTRRATRESGEPAPCGAVRGGTVWYRYRAPADTGFIANTFGSTYATTLAVFEANGSRSVGCDTDVQGNSIVQFAAEEGATYLFQVTGAAGGGDLVFTLDPEGTTSLVSASPSGAPANRGAANPSVSPDGRFVVFESESTNLVRTDTRGQNQIYMRDRKRSALTLVSVSSTGRAGDGRSSFPFASDDGRYVVFESDATNLVPGDSNGERDVFVRDVRDGWTERVSVSSEGEQLRYEAPTEWGEATPDKVWQRKADDSDATMYPSITPDGRYVVFQSRAANLVRGDHNHVIDVFVHDRVTRLTERVSVSSTGRERDRDWSYSSNGNEDSMIPSISGDGRFVMFRTSASNLVSDDDNLSHDIFVRDQKDDTTKRIAAADRPAHVDDHDEPRYAMNEIRPRAALSFDGRHATFSAGPRPTFGPAEVNIFAYDSRSRRTAIVNVSSTGEHMEPTGATARLPSMSADGRFVAFHSNATNLVPGSPESVFNVFVRDLVTQTTIRLTSFTGRNVQSGAVCQEADVPGCGSLSPAISADGSVVTFEGALGGGSFFVPPGLVQIYVNERPLPAR